MDESLPDLPAGWSVWNAEPGGRVILAYRPDVFEGSSFPAACLPTLYVSPSDPDQRPGARGRSDSRWHVSLYLEPEVRVRDRDADVADRETAIETARTLAADFSAGEIDFRDVYQVPREAYLDELERLTGAGQGA
jgi:hypothetical protein